MPRIYPAAPTPPGTAALVFANNCLLDTPMNTHAAQSAVAAVKTFKIRHSHCGFAVFGLRALARQGHLQPSKRHGPNSEHTAIGDPIFRRCGAKKAAYCEAFVKVVGEARLRAAGKPCVEMVAPLNRLFYVRAY
jgi:hypothetical protein